jgi:GNAT superfamily N-acetyltransferase
VWHPFGDSRVIGGLTRSIWYAVVVTREPSIAPTQPEHLPGIFALYRRYLAREPNEARIAMHASQFPSAVLTLGEQVVGFVFTVDFAPDVLELANILIDPAHRLHGHGERLMAYVEAASKADFSSIILVNSMLYTSAEQKRPATRFYLRLGYRLIAETQYTNIFYKDL